MCAFSNTVGFDDAPFPPGHQGDVPIVGAVYSGTRFDGVVIGAVRKDGFDGAARICTIIENSKFHEHIQLVLMQGVTMAGFNVVDVFRLSDRLEIPIVVVSRRRPDFNSIKHALLGSIADGAEKWNVVERLGPMHAAGSVFVQCVGIDPAEAGLVVDRLSVNGNMPEPIRAAHLIAGAIAGGESRGSP